MHIKKGLYRHYKGGLYEVVCRATHSETLEDMIVYKGSNGAVWVRPASMWNEIVDTPSGKMRRFTKIETQDLLTPNMREETLEEQKAVENYLEKISEPTGESFWDLVTESERNEFLDLVAENEE